MPLPFEIIQVTAAYSNAVLVAIMPHVSDFAKKLDLPIPQPVIESQVENFRCSSRSDHVGGRVVLTNGCQFVFDYGGIRAYESPHSYYALQDPNLIPRFYGPVKLSEAEAVQIAHQAIKKLGYSDEILSADMPPQVTTPPYTKSNYVPRYRIRWVDPTRGSGGPAHLPPSIEFEVNATTGEIEMLNISNPNTWKSTPQIGVHPRTIGKSPETTYRGGRKIYPVSETYSNALLAAILPQFSAYARTMGFSGGHAIALNDIDRAKSMCGLVDNDPMATVNLKNGTRFDYRHGQVVAYYAPDVMDLPGRDHPRSPVELEKFRAKFYGRINLTQKESVDLVRQAIRNLGYSEKILHTDEVPVAWGPSWWGTNQIARCSMQWRDATEETIRVQAEVDMNTKSIKSLFINDHANINIWRIPPRIDTPLN